MTPNAGRQARLEAGATQERKLLGVGSSIWFSWECAPSPAVKTPAHPTPWCPPLTPPRSGTIPPVPGEPMPSRGHRDPQLLTDTCHRELEDLVMAWHRGTTMRDGIFPNRVFSPFPHEPTPVLPQVAEQVAPFHGTAVCGTTRICDAAVSSRWIGSSTSASGSVHDGSGGGSGSP